ncbi:MAG: hypothetical protein L0332_04830 [Chloroflexi bacterium]|nr:hypothetical protein [Chloroflexota bacterium]MCI0580088.1 hypothetical protein [Chloroflexota bacterium]MCI0649336.1 hypothetical protein [Chloroflexota bacterium]MCI0726032.1 hypothetical protein [Chloroflexota bacterium]
METPNSGLKLLLSYNIRSEVTQEYYEFVLGRYVPIMQAMGLEMSEAWHTAYGEYPNRLIGFVARERDTMLKVLSNETWEALNEQLAQYVTDFSYKVVQYELGFQL